MALDTDEVLLLGGGLVLAYLVFNRGATGRADSTSASGVPPNKGTNLEAAIGGAIGAGACLAAGAALGAPQAGAAAAGLCATIGGKLAPAAVAAGKWVGHETAAGAKAVASGAVAGAKLGAAAAAGAVNELYNNPAAVVTVPTQIAGRLVGGATKLADRGTAAIWGALPAPLKLATAPIYVPAKLTIAAAGKVAGVAGAGAGALATGAKAATNAVSGAAKKILSIF